jgi:hypothetical protein
MLKPLEPLQTGFGHPFQLGRVQEFIGKRATLWRRTPDAGPLH